MDSLIRMSLENNGIFFAAPDVAPASKCPIESFCLNGGECSYYEMIGELVCRLVRNYDKLCD